LFCTNPVTIPFSVFVRCMTLKSGSNRIFWYSTPLCLRENYQFQPFFAFSRARTHVYTHQNSNQTHYGNRSTLTKSFFKIFSFAKFEYLHQTLGVQNTPRPRPYVLSVFECSFTFPCNLYFPTFATKYKKCNLNTIIFLTLTIKAYFEHLFYCTWIKVYFFHFCQQNKNRLIC